MNWYYGERIFQDSPELRDKWSDDLEVGLKIADVYFDYLWQITDDGKIHLTDRLHYEDRPDRMTAEKEAAGELTLSFNNANELFAHFLPKMKDLVSKNTEFNAALQYVEQRCAALAEGKETSGQQQVILVERDYKSSYERFALTEEEFKKEFPETYESFGPIKEADTDTLRPLVHIWFSPCVIGDDQWNSFFSDMTWGLSESDIESGNHAYIREDMFVSLGEHVAPFLANSKNVKTPYPNTKISYLYRDADNYKTYNEVVVKGMLTGEQKRNIYDSLFDGEYFIPSQVGLPEQRFNDGWTEADHCWFELDEDSFEPTDKLPTVDVCVEDLVKAFCASKNCWDDTLLPQIKQAEASYHSFHGVVEGLKTAYPSLSEQIDSAAARLANQNSLINDKEKPISPER